MYFSEPDIIQCFLVWVSYQADEDSIDWILGSKPGSDPLPLWISRCAALSEALGFSICRESGGFRGLGMLLCCGRLLGGFQGTGTLGDLKDSCPVP